jgi:hypothetical protein
MLTIAGISLVAANALIQLSTKLDNAVQHIERVIFAVPDLQGSRKTDGRVEVVADNVNKTISINGSLITNVEHHQTSLENNKTSSNISILGGNKHSTKHATGSTIIGGDSNTITSAQALIGGGQGNTITESSSRSTILGGETNTISGQTSTIIGGQGNKITANNAIVIGNNSTVGGANSLAAGSNVNNNQANTFAWSDGSSFSPTKPNLFAVKGTRGAVVAGNVSHASASLTLNGDLRVQPNSNKFISLNSCTSDLHGVLQSVSNSGNNTQTCPCLCSK